MEMQSQEIGEVAKALAMVQGRLRPVGKSGTVDVPIKSGRKTYRFAPLPDIWDAIRAPLAEAGLAVVQLVHVLEGVDGAGRDPVLVTTIMHGSGQWVRGVCPIRVLGQDAQAFGSAITYARRYALCAALGVVSDEDDDGVAASAPAGWAAHAPPPPPPPPGASPPPPPPSGDWVSPPEVAADDAKLAALRHTLSTSGAQAVVELLVQEAIATLPAPLADAFRQEARVRWELLAQQQPEAA